LFLKELLIIVGPINNNGSEIARNRIPLNRMFLLVAIVQKIFSKIQLKERKIK